MDEFGRVSALAFDYYGTVADKQGLGSVINEHVPRIDGYGLAKLWFQTCQRYCFQNGMMGRYAPWSELSAHALDFAAAEFGVGLPDEVRVQLLAADGEAPIYPDAAPALARLAGRYALYVLSMGTEGMIRASQRRAGIDRFFRGVITTTADRVYKPSRAAYDVGVREIGLEAAAIGFVSGNSFDVIGAKNYGFPTIWVRRYGQPLDGLGLAPDLVVADLADLAGALGT